jgi:hypothetical protein
MLMATACVHVCTWLCWYACLVWQLCSQKSAATSAAWDEVKVALAETATEIRIERQDEAGPGGGVDPALWKCSTLKILRLRLQKEMLTSLPPSLGQLINLTELIVSHNSLASLPAEIGALVNLKFLEAEANCLTVLPDELSNCLAMEVVNVTGNQLTSLAPLCGLAEMKSILAGGERPPSSSRGEQNGAPRSMLF